MRRTVKRRDERYKMVANATEWKARDVANACLPWNEDVPAWKLAEAGWLAG